MQFGFKKNVGTIHAIFSVGLCKVVNYFTENAFFIPIDNMFKSMLYLEHSLIRSSWLNQLKRMLVGEIVDKHRRLKNLNRFKSYNSEKQWETSHKPKYLNSVENIIVPNSTVGDTTFSLYLFPRRMYSDLLKLSFIPNSKKNSHIYQSLLGDPS